MDSGKLAHGLWQWQAGISIYRNNTITLYIVCCVFLVSTLYIVCCVFLVSTLYVVYYCKHPVKCV